MICLLMRFTLWLLSATMHKGGIPLRITYFMLLLSLKVNLVRPWGKFQ